MRLNCWLHDCTICLVTLSSVVWRQCSSAITVGTRGELKLKITLSVFSKMLVTFIMCGFSFFGCFFQPRSDWMISSSPQILTVSEQAKIFPNRHHRLHFTYFYLPCGSLSILSGALKTFSLSNCSILQRQLHHSSFTEYDAQDFGYLWELCVVIGIKKT